MFYTNRRSPVKALHFHVDARAGADEDAAAPEQGRGPRPGDPGVLRGVPLVRDDERVRAGGNGGSGGLVVPGPVGRSRPAAAPLRTLSIRQRWKAGEKAATVSPTHSTSSIGCHG